MSLDAILEALEGPLRQAWPALTVYTELPNSAPKTPSALFWPAPGGQFPWPGDVVDELVHEFELRVLFSLANAPASDKRARQMIEPLRFALSRSGTIGSLRDPATPPAWKVSKAGVTGYRYGHVAYAGVAYLGLTLMCKVAEVVVAGEVR